MKIDQEDYRRMMGQRPVIEPLKVTKNSDKFCCGECGKNFDNLGSIIVHLNDMEHYSFEQIAGAIEYHNIPIEKIDIEEERELFPDAKDNYVRSFLIQNDIFQPGEVIVQANDALHPPLKECIEPYLEAGKVVKKYSDGTD